MVRSCVKSAMSTSRSGRVGDSGDAAPVGEPDLRRYARQLKLFGEEGQKRLKKAKVTIAGAGGLGSVTAVDMVVTTQRICEDTVAEIVKDSDLIVDPILTCEDCGDLDSW